MKTSVINCMSKKHFPLNFSVKNVRYLIYAFFFLFLLLIISAFVFPQLFLQKVSSNNFDRNYIEYNLVQSRFEAVYSYLIACYDNKTSFFLSRPIRQLLLENVSLDHLPTPWYFQTQRAYQMLILLKKIQDIDSSFFINSIVNDMQVGTDTYDFFGPAFLWDFYKILKSLNATNQVPRENWIAMCIDDYNEHDGSFQPYKNGVSTIQWCKNAYFLLKELDALDLINWTKTTKFIQGLQLPDGSFQNPLLMGAGLPAATAYAYSFFNASCQIDLINSTQTYNILINFYTQNLFETKNCAVLSFLVDFTQENGYKFTKVFPNTTQLVQQLIISQSSYYGGFPNEWDLDPNSQVSSLSVDIISTSDVLKVLIDCNSLNLLNNEDITIKFPPMSSFYDSYNVTNPFFSIYTICPILITFILKRLHKRGNTLNLRN